MRLQGYRKQVNYIDTFSDLSSITWIALKLSEEVIAGLINPKGKPDLNQFKYHFLNMRN